MSNIIETSDAIEIIEGAIDTMTGLQQTLKDTVQRLTPLADENISLRDTIRQLEADDAAVDAALTRLRDKLPQPEPAAPTEPTPPTAEEISVAEGSSESVETITEPVGNSLDDQEAPAPPADPAADSVADPVTDDL